MAEEGSQVMDVANPCMERAKDYVFVVAIDFGTTYSGYAFSTKENPSGIVMNKNWGSEMATQTWKTPTAILTDRKKEFVAFGYQAKSKYQGKKSGHIYDEYFKMKLYSATSYDEEIMIPSRDGKQKVSLQKLITWSLKYLYQHFLDTLNKAYESVKEHLIRVMLTIPAIWTDSAKDFMKRAACEAGIGDDRLILTLEPEAASLCCRELKPDEFNMNTDDNLKLSCGTKYMVVDCGGGTIDITAHEVDVDNTSVKEIHCAHGGPWGGSKINEKFEHFLDDLLDKDFIKSYKKSHPQDWFTINTNFEYIKRTHNATDEDYTINLPYSIIECYNGRSTRFRRKNIERHINKRTGDGVEFESGKLIMSPSCVVSLFSDTVNKIIALVREHLSKKKLSDVQYVFLVGGFSESDHLFERMKSEIKVILPNLRVLRPTDATVAVLKGALYFGHNPIAIKSRISRLTYGAGVMRPFNRDIHDEFRKRMIDGKEKCADLMQVWARKNESIQVGEKRTFAILPSSKEATKFASVIYAKDDEEIMYTTEPGVKKLATLEIPIPDKQLAFEDRRVEHSVYFGGTQLYVRIEDKARPDGATKEATIVFEHEHANDH